MASSEYRLTIPRLAVMLADGRSYTVQALNPDLLAWDRTAAKFHWPSGQSAPFLWLTFLAWHASVRTGDVPPDTTWEAFSDTLAIEVKNVTDDPAPDGTANGYADPTPVAAAPE